MAAWAVFAEFSDARFGADARFVGASFGGNTRFVGVSFAEACNFSGTRFDGEALALDRVTFPEMIAIAGYVRSLSARNTRFLAGADLRLPKASAQLDGAEFARPSVLSDARVLSLREARVGELTLAGVDLSECRFAGARGVDSMRLEGDSRLPWSPGGWRWTARRVIVFESRSVRLGQATPDPGDDDRRVTVRHAALTIQAQAFATPRTQPMCAGNRGWVAPAVPGRGRVST
jgi:hypothetical protein